MPETTTPAPLPNPGSGTSTNPNLAVVPPPETKRRSPSTLNRAQESELCRASVIVTAAQKPAYAAVLAEHDITAPFVTALDESIDATSKKSRSAVSCTTAKLGATASEHAAERALMFTLRRIQAAARQKFLPTQPTKLTDYYIGQRINESRPLLETISQNIVSKAIEDQLPGITQEILSQATARRTDYINASGTQTTELSRGKQARAERDAQVDSIKERRRKIQCAADVAWPPNEPASVAARKEFMLPLRRPFAV